jgi:hypothetical protein
MAPVSRTQTWLAAGRKGANKVASLVVAISEDLHATGVPASQLANPAAKAGPRQQPGQLQNAGGQRAENLQQAL